MAMNSVTVASLAKRRPAQWRYRQPTLGHGRRTLRKRRSPAQIQAPGRNRLSEVGETKITLGSSQVEHNLLLIE